VKQLEDGYVRFVALGFFFLCAKFCPFWCRHVKVTTNDKVGRCLGTQCIYHKYQSYNIQQQWRLDGLYCCIKPLSITKLWQLWNRKLLICTLVVRGFCIHDDWLHHGTVWSLPADTQQSTIHRSSAVLEQKVRLRPNVACSPINSSIQYNN